MILKRISLLSGKMSEMNINIPEDELLEWLKMNPRPLIQNHFPQLSPDEREFILTGITSKEWDEICKVL